MIKLRMKFRLSLCCIVLQSGALAEYIADLKGYNPVKYLIRIQLIFISLCTFGFFALLLGWSAVS